MGRVISIRRRRQRFEVLRTDLDEQNPSETGTRVWREWRHLHNASTIPQTFRDEFKEDFNDDLDWVDCENPDNSVDENPTIHQFTGDPSIRIPNISTMSCSQIYQSTLRYGGYDVLNDIVIPRMNSYLKYRRNLEISRENLNSK